MAATLFDSNLQKNTIVLDVRFKKPTTTKRGNMTNVEVDADKDSVNLTKEVIRSKNFKRARIVEANVKILIRKFALKSPFRAGTFLLPIPALDTIYPALEDAQVEYKKYRDAFVDEWDEIVEDARRRLRDQFVPEDYPSANVMRRKFGMSWQCLTFKTPDKEVLGEVLYEQERDKARATWKNAEAEVVGALRESMNELIGHLIEKLKPQADGKRSTLRNSAITNVQEFLDNFSKRNVLNDEELNTLVAQASRVLNGKSVESLKSEDARVVVSRGLKKVSKELEGLVTKSSRKMNFDE